MDIRLEVVRGDPVVTAIPGEKVQLTYYDKLRVNVSFDYRGPAIKTPLYAAIGIKDTFFNEKVHGEAELGIMASPDTLTPNKGSVDIPITSAILPGTNYDIYCKFTDYPGAGMPEVLNAVDIVGIPPSYTLVQHTVYPRAKTYVGKAEKCIFDLTLPEALWLTDWLGPQVVNAFATVIKDHGAEMLDLKIYEDKTAIITRNYRVEAIATKPKTVAVAAIAIPWAIVITAILAILFLVALYLFFIHPIVELDWGKPAAVGVAAVGIFIVALAVTAIASAAKGKKKGG